MAEFPLSQEIHRLARESGPGATNRALRQVAYQVHRLEGIAQGLRDSVRGVMTDQTWASTYDEFVKGGD